MCGFATRNVRNDAQCVISFGSLQTILVWKDVLVQPCSPSRSLRISVHVAGGLPLHLGGLSLK